MTVIWYLVGTTYEWAKKLVAQGQLTGDRMIEAVKHFVERDVVEWTSEEAAAIRVACEELKAKKERSDDRVHATHELLRFTEKIYRTHDGSYSACGLQYKKQVMKALIAALDVDTEKFIDAVGAAEEMWDVLVRREYDVPVENRMPA